MSHQQRTPLNSLLLLSDQLTRNAEGNLNQRQVEAAKTIHSSGNDLLTLINDILDLSKIESGTVAVDAVDLLLDDLRNFVERTFRHVGEAKNVEFAVSFDLQLPKSIHTDAKRLQQIIKNLLSNAFKFTQRGQVKFTVELAEKGWSCANDSLNRASQVLAFEVSDTGIGIAADKQQIIFEAFQQADGATNRKYGGTGLGLAISRELSWLLGGEIHLHSAPGEGSRFTLYLPAEFVVSGQVKRPAATMVSMAIAPAPEAVAVMASDPPILADEAGDDRHEIAPGDRVLLVVENDLSFARMVADAAHDHGFKAVITGFGAAAL